MAQFFAEDLIAVIYLITQSRQSLQHFSPVLWPSPGFHFLMPPMVSEQRSKVMFLGCPVRVL